jgi:hypothetical protein
MKLIRVKTMGQVQAEKQSGKKLECRKYNTKYLSLEFTNIDGNGKKRPQCFLCMKILAVDNMKPNSLTGHLEAVNAKYV